MNKKIYCLWTKNKSYYIIKFSCYGTSANNTKIIEELNYQLKEDDFENETLINSIKEDLKRIEFNKSSIIIALNLVDVFIESLKIPNLNMIDASKALSLELRKLYGDEYKNKYIYLSYNYKESKNVNEYFYVMCSKQLYKKFINLCNLLQLKVEKVFYLPGIISEYLTSKKVISKKEVSLIINIDYYQTSLLVIKGNILFSDIKIPIGINLLNDINDEKIVININNECKKIVTEINKVLYTSPHKIDSIYFNIEEESYYSLIKSKIEKELKQELLDIDLDNNQKLGVQSIVNINTSTMLSSLFTNNYQFKVRAK